MSFLSTPGNDGDQYKSTVQDKIKNIRDALANPATINAASVSTHIQELQAALLEFIKAKFQRIQSSSESDKKKLQDLTALFGSSIDVLWRVTEHVDNLSKGTAQRAPQ